METAYDNKSENKKGSGDQTLITRKIEKESLQHAGQENADFNFQHVYMNQGTQVDGNCESTAPPALPPHRRMSDDPLTRREKPPALPPRNAGSASKAEGLSCGFVNTRRGGFSGSPKKWKDERERVSRAGRIAYVPPALQEKSLKSAQQTLSLLEFVEKYSNSLPAQVSVEKGHYGSNDPETLGNQEKLIISFVKSRKVLNIVTSTQQTFALPLGSAVQLSLLYNPDGNEHRALRGYMFQSVGELVRKSPNLPRVICATQAYKGNGLKSTVLENELLVVENYNAQTKRLQVISLSKNSICKFLPLQCSGCFTTNPTSVRMYVSDICNYIGIPRCSLYGLLDMSELAVLAVDTHIDQSLYSIIKLAGFTTEKSLIGTRVMEEGVQNTQPKAFFEIPVNDNLSGVAVKVIQTNMATEGQFPQPLVDSDVKLEVWYQEGSTAVSKFQRFLDDYIRHGHEGEGLSINAASANIYELVDSQPSPSSPKAEAKGDETDRGTASTKDERIKSSAAEPVNESNSQQLHHPLSTERAYGNTCDNNCMSMTRTELEATVRVIVNEVVNDQKQHATPEKGMGGYYYTTMDWEIGKVLKLITATDRYCFRRFICDLED